VCEVSFDPDPIAAGADPSNTDKLAQRNLAFVSVANPGVDPSRIIPQTFEIKPTPAVLKLDQKPDELVIDWGNVPSGSVAQIYLPGTTSAAILSWASRLYTTHNLLAYDPFTIKVPTGGMTYIPIPKGGPINLAGLLSIQLPPGIHKGESYEVIVRQITSEDYQAEPIPQIRSKKAGAVSVDRPRQFAWRRTSGVFKLTIPVSTKENLLETEERYYAILQYIKQSIPTASRWYPIFVRYVSQIAGRVSGMGGDPSTIPPSGTGTLPSDGSGCGEGAGERGLEFLGKVAGLIYDHFGDFEGFLLERGCGSVVRFRSRERRMERVIREAWQARSTVIVLVSHKDPTCPIEVVLGAPPPDCC
jgi:hypothetical protein